MDNDNTGTPTGMTVGEKQKDCPHCGRCPTCGRRGYNPWYPYPYPYEPWYPYPYIWTTENTDTGNVTVRFS